MPKGNKELAGLLLTYGADVNAPSAFGNHWSPGIICAQERDVELGMLRLLFENSSRIAIDYHDNEGRTMIWRAAARGDADIVEFLLTRSPAANVDVRDLFGATLIGATRNGQVDIVSHLLHMAGDKLLLVRVDHFGLDVFGWSTKTADPRTSELLK